MKRILPAVFALSMLFLISCEDASDEVYADVQQQEATNGALGDFDAHRRDHKPH